MIATSVRVGTTGRHPSLDMLFAVAALLVMFGVSGCQTAAPRRDATVSTLLPDATPAPVRAALLRREMVDSPASFHETVRLLTEPEVDKIREGLRKRHEDEPWIAAVFPAKKYDRDAILELAKRERKFPEKDPVVTAAEGRRQFVALLDEATLIDLAKRLDALEAHRRTFCKDKKPLLRNIGTQAILTYEKRPPQGPGASTSKEEAERRRAVRIPFDGYDLHPLCVNVDVLITGTVPLSAEAWGKNLDFYVSKPEDDRLDSGNPDSGDIILLPRYLDRLSSGDRVTVQFAVSQRRQYGDQDRIVSKATRTFTMYEVEDFRRKVLGSRIPLHDIAAFPLPETEVENLFGPLISQNFFVVRLSVRNTEPEAKLISTGMITAMGRAIVEPQGKGVEGIPTFTIPVTMVPSSLQQTFAILDDEEVNQPRAVIFRTLELVGALATAATAAFTFSLDVSKGIGILTGVAIPELKKWSPDRWPGYKRNVVNFAAPDLLKVPSNAIADHKLLFFSKKNLELLVTDQTLFGTSHGAKNLNRTSDYWFGPRASNQPTVRVISLAFDSLDVRFEKVFDVAALTIRDRVAALLEDLPKQVERLSFLDRTWVDGPITTVRFADTLSLEEWKVMNHLIKIAQSALEKRKTEAADLPDLLKQLAAVARALSPEAGVAEGFRKDLILSEALGLNGLRAAQLKLSQISRRVTAGAEGGQLEDEVKGMEDVLRNSKAALDFYVSAARLLLNKDVKDALQALIGGAKVADLTVALAKAVDAVKTTEGELAANRTKVEEAKAQGGDVLKHAQKEEKAAEEILETARKASDKASADLADAKKTNTVSDEAWKKVGADAQAVIRRELQTLRALRPDAKLNLMSGVTWEKIKD